MELLEQEEAAPPKLRLKTSGAYRRFLLGDLCTFSLGRNIKQGEASPEFETPCVRYGELYHMYGEVIEEVVNRTNLDRSELLFSQGNEILLPSAGEDPMDIGNASALTLKDIAIGRTINILRPLRPDAYCHKYVAYYIREKLRETIAALAQGVSISNVYNTQLRTLEVKLPTLPEQQKIAAFLGAVDRKIQQLKRKQELLERYKKGVVQQLFRQELRFKRKDGGEFPEWEEKRLGDVLKFQVGSPFSSSFFNEQGIGLRLVKNRDLKSDDQPYHFNGPYEDRYLVSDGDILIGMDGDFLPCRWKNGPALLNQRVGRILVTGAADKEFLYFYLFKELEAIQHRTASTTVKHLSHTDVENIIGLLPSLEEQTRIAGFLIALDAKVAGVAQAVAAAQKWKKGLLQQMFV